MDELKKYIQNHAEELDLDEPRPQVWERIQQQSGAVKKPATVFVFARWAAAACIVLLAGIGTWHLYNKPENKTTELAVQTEQKTAKPVPVQKEPVAEETTATQPLAQTILPVKKQDIIAGKKRYKTNEAAVMGSLQNLENSFTQVINLQRERVGTIPMFAESPEYFNDFKIQIQQMEKDEKVIKSDIARRGMTDASLDQLINLYQQKLNVLKQLQTEMTKTNNRYKQNRGPVDATKAYFLKI